MKFKFSLYIFEKYTNFEFR